MRSKVCRYFLLAALPTAAVARESLEIGVERFQPVAPTANANFTGVLINYYFSKSFYLGTSQSALYLRGDSDYRPDLHIGALKVMAQTQFGGYLQSDTSAFNASLWLGLGATVRIAM